jgi:hypothetical protein
MVDVYVNFPTIPVASTNQVVGGVCNAFIQYIPLDTEIKAYWGVGIWDQDLYTNIRVNRIKGKFRQYDSAGNLLQENDVDVTRGNAQQFTVASGVYMLELWINYIELIYLYSISLSVDQVLTGTTNTIISISSISSTGDVTYIVYVKPNKVITTAKIREIVTVTGTPPVRTFNITTTNTGSYIKEWWAEIKAVSGTPNPNDRLILELLDASDNVLASNNVGIGVGNRIAVQHNTSGAKIRVTLNSSVLGLSVDVDVSEAIDITVS